MSIDSGVAREGHGCMSARRRWNIFANHSEARTMFTSQRLLTVLWRKRIELHEPFVICVFSSISSVFYRLLYLAPITTGDLSLDPAGGLQSTYPIFVSVNKILATPCRLSPCLSSIDHFSKAIDPISGVSGQERLDKLTSDLEMWYDGLPWHSLGQVWRPRSQVKVHGHRRKMFLKWSVRPRVRSDFLVRTLASY